MTGIEPASSVWKTEALPLSYARAAPAARGTVASLLNQLPASHTGFPSGDSNARTRKPTAYTGLRHGVWRSLVAHSLWERGAVGSNPATPTDINYP